MTRDEVARIAKLAGIEKDHDVFFSVGEEEMDVHIDDLKRFAELVLESRAEKQKPMAWIVEFENGEQELHFDEQSIGEIHTPLYTQRLQIHQERNFCPRCGKRLFSDNIHTCTPPVEEKREPVAWLITDENINHLQVESIQKLIDRARHAHMTDIKLRINGQDEWYQADWLKHMTRTSPPQRQPLTDEQIDELSRTMVKGNKSVNWLARAIEAAHGIKGEV
jgi:hypothetical protein